MKVKMIGPSEEREARTQQRSTQELLGALPCLNLGYMDACTVRNHWSLLFLYTFLNGCYNSQSNSLKKSQ